MERTYFAYADSVDGQTNFSLTRGDRQYFGRFTDENDRDDLVSAVQASLFQGDNRNLVLDSDEEKIPSGGWSVSYRLSDAIEAGKSYTVSADILLDTASTTGLTEETEYTAYARMKETVTLYASPISAGKVFETEPAIPPIDSWEWVQWHVRNGTHLDEFEVGDIFTCLYDDGSSP